MDYKHHHRHRTTIQLHNLYTCGKIFTDRSQTKTV